MSEETTHNVTLVKESLIIKDIEDIDLKIDSNITNNKLHNSVHKANEVASSSSSSLYSNAESGLTNRNKSEKNNPDYIYRANLRHRIKYIDNSDNSNDNINELPNAYNNNSFDLKKQNNTSNTKGASNNTHFAYNERNKNISNELNLKAIIKPSEQDDANTNDYINQGKGASKKLDANKSSSSSSSSHKSKSKSTHVPLIKLNEFISDASIIDNGIVNNYVSDENEASDILDQNNNIFINGIKLESVTKDHSKDYSSDSSEQDVDNSKHLKLTFKQNQSFGKNSKKYDDSSNEHINKSGDTKRVQIVAPLDSVDNETIENENSKNDQKTNPVDLKIFELLDKTSKKFILKPATLGLNLKSQIFRQKGLYPQYRYYIENLDGNLLLIMTARKKKKSKTACYIINSISFDLNNIYKFIETPIAKLKSNLLGTQFTLYDFGKKPQSTHKSNNSNTLDANLNNQNTSKNFESSELSEEHYNFLQPYEFNRKEYLSVSYQLNLLGIKGPREMSIIIPGMDGNLNRDDFILKSDNDSLASAWKEIEFDIKLKNDQLQPDTNLTVPSTKKSSPSKLSSFKKSIYQLSPSSSTSFNKDNDGKRRSKDYSDQEAEKNKSSSQDSSQNLKLKSNVVKLINKSPEWHKELNSFALNFNGRVTMSSAKNFQIVHETNTDYIIMQFGKVNKDQYTSDYSYPLCALQAFGIAITSLDNKLGCD